MTFFLRNTLKKIRQVLFNLILSPQEKEAIRLKNLPRYQMTTTRLFNKPVFINDANTYLSSLTEIFDEEIYKFNTSNKFPIIIDCGANIGLASMYFAKNYEGAKIYSFEPDPNLYNCLVHNSQNCNKQNSVIYSFNNAVSNANGKILFHLEGGHSGMIVHESSEATKTIKSIRLRDFLIQFNEIDFLKIDIEGHEISVIPDIKDQLHKVQNMFIEYHSFIGQKQQLAILLKIIEECGFRYYLKEAYNKKFPFIQREIFIGFDFLVNIFCYKK